jgi:putative tryptophan/tyrosine transport system substrate-binding protein
MPSALAVCKLMAKSNLVDCTGFLHDLVPKAVRIAVLVNPANAAVTEATLRDIPEAARALGLQIQFLNASTSREIEAAFATLVRDRADALFVAPDGFFVARRVQFATPFATDRSDRSRRTSARPLPRNIGTDRPPANDAAPSTR